jgi:hypothetical protein
VPFRVSGPVWRARGMSGIVYSDSTVVGVIADNSPPSRIGPAKANLQCFGKKSMVSGKHCSTLVL